MKKSSPAPSDDTSPSTDTTQAGLKHLETLSWLLDSALRIPGTPLRVGIDSILGLIPGIGDGLSAVFSSYIVLHAIRLGVPIWTVVRMVLNILIDTVLGAVPVVGDIFDITWKANSRNLHLLREAHPSLTKEETRNLFEVTRVLSYVVLLGGLVVISLGTALIIALLRFIWISL